MNPKPILNTILALYICFQAVAQREDPADSGLSGQLTFYLLDMESGLAHNVVNSIEQDSLGYIWIATIEGISRYNGSHFLNFKQNAQAADQSLANNFIQQIRLSDDGKLLIATDGGVNIYNLKEERFDLFQQKDGLLTNSISSLYETPEGKIIVGAYRYGIQIIDAKGKVAYSLSHDATDAGSLSSNQVTAITMQGDSIAWIGTFNGGLNKLNIKTKSNRRLFQETSSSPASQINALYTDGEANVWVGTKAGIKVITGKGDTLAISQGDDQSKGLSDGEVLSFEEDKLGNMWVGTRNGGLNILPIADFLESGRIDFTWYLPRSDGSSVFNRTVSAIKRSKDGSMWLGTSTGLNFVSPRGEPIKLLQRNPNSLQTLSHNRIGAVATGVDNKVWIGTDGGGLDLYEPKTRTFKNYHQQPGVRGSLSNNYVISLKEDSKGRLWAGTYHGGLNRLDQRSGIFYHYLQGGVQDGVDVRVIAEDQNQHIWVGTNQGGLYRYSESSDSFDYIETLGKIDIRAIAFDSQRRLWLATFGSGVICYDPETQQVIPYHESTVENMPGNIYFCIDVLPNQEVIAGSRYGGLVRISPANQDIRVFTESDGLSNNTISSMVTDSRGLVWLGTYNGISFYDPVTDQIDHLNTYDNIQRSEFNIGAATLAQDNVLYFGGNKGVNFFNPAKLEQQAQNYSLVIENFKLFNNRVNVGEQLLEKAMPYTDHLTLSHDQTLFSFDFAILKFPYAQNVSFAYKLEDYHQHWVQVQGNGTANLSNIPPGTYTLLVKARIGNDQEIEKRVQIMITPPFWKTFPAYLLYGIIALALMVGFFRYYSERVKLKNSLVLEKQQRLLEHEINEERIRFFTNFSHELKTPLTLILAPLEELAEQLKSVGQRYKLALIQKNAAYLHQLIENLLEFRKTETGMSQLVVGEYNLSLLLEEWVQNYQGLAKKQQVMLTWSLSERNMLARFDSGKLQMIVNNLLSNALKYSKSGAKVHVSLYSDVNKTYIAVSDTGLGIPAEDSKRIFDWFYRSGTKIKKSGTGIGLALAKSLTELHGGTIKVTSEMGKGSTFIVEIPKDLRVSAPEKWNYEPAETQSVLMDSSLPYQEVLMNGDEERQIILLIDDNTDVLSYLDSLLRKEYDLIHAQDGEDGLDKAFRHVPDLIISDIMMPIKDGLDLCATLKRNPATSHIPIILLSAIGNVDSMQKGYREGADAYISKPFHSQLLQARVKNLLENRRTLRKHFMGQNYTAETLDERQNDLLQGEKKFLSRLNQIVLAQIGKEETQVETIVQEMGMSRSSLFRKVKAITGYNINTYIRMTKVLRAAELISDNKLTISQVAFESGFNDMKYFRKVFKEQFGVLPSQYRK